MRDAMYVSSRSAEASRKICKLIYSVYILTYLITFSIPSLPFCLTLPINSLPTVLQIQLDTRRPGEQKRRQLNVLSGLPLRTTI